ncbi:MAG: hypothetical protein LBQ37_00555 [Elusimicrobiota bacterium]|nr:hypothetical protein [Elusimicrobiota bacterium]
MRRYRKFLRQKEFNMPYSYVRQINDLLYRANISTREEDTKLEVVAKTMMDEGKDWQEVLDATGYWTTETILISVKQHRNERQAKDSLIVSKVYE